jgi:hypothetical protein
MMRPVARWLGLAGVTLALMLASCGGGKGGSEAPPQEPGGPLPGASTALARDALVDRVEARGVPLVDFAEDAAGRLVALTELEIGLVPGATVGQVNGMLRGANAQVVAMARGVGILLVSIPHPGGVAALDALVLRLEADPAVRFVRRAFVPATRGVPDNHADLAQVDKIAHLLAVNAHGAWHVKGLLAQAPSVPPTLIVADKFGDGEPLDDYDIGGNSANYSNSLFDFHGYAVLGVIAADHAGTTTGRGLATGIYPGTAQVVAIDMHAPASLRSIRTQPGAEWAMIGELITNEVLAQPANVVVNTSIGFDCSTKSKARANCSDANARQEALTWIEKVRGRGLENRFVHITAAGNTEWRGDAEWPADTDARFDSPFAAARLIGDLTQPDGTPVPALDKTLVVENLIAAGTPPRPVCLNGDLAGRNASKVHGDIAAIGTDVWTLTGPQAGAGAMTGTSFAAPQVAGLAAYVWALEPRMGALGVVELLLDTSRRVELSVADDARCSTTLPARVVDAYRAVLAIDSPDGLAGGPPELTRARRELLDVADAAGAPGRNGRFDDKDVELLLGLFTAQDGALDYSRHDLNGDGRTGGDAASPFDLDIDRAFTTVNRRIGTRDVGFDEAAVSDLQVLCYYAWSPLYADTGADGEARRQTLLGGLCGEVSIDAQFWGRESYVEADANTACSSATSLWDSDIYSHPPDDLGPFTKTITVGVSGELNPWHGSATGRAEASAAQSSSILGSAGGRITVRAELSTTSSGAMTLIDSPSCRIYSPAGTGFNLSVLVPAGDFVVDVRASGRAQWQSLWAASALGSARAIVSVVCVYADRSGDKVFNGVADTLVTAGSPEFSISETVLTGGVSVGCHLTVGTNSGVNARYEPDWTGEPFVLAAGGSSDATVTLTVRPR